MFSLWEADLLLLLSRIFFIVISIVYTFFAFMVVRQVSLMNKGFATPLHGFFTFLAWVHFFVALLAVALVLLVL
ncbi:hypothetical protein KJ605_01465 [Patescibacteria group bacterium]|nr:hypothetical protein [Patescibacteria group bacterium]MBU1970424.1 hypothetical protein [Patescibacteria group bacterium]